MSKIPLSRVYQSEVIDRRILEVVRGGNFILGPECKAFEKELAEYFGVKHVVLSSSWTAAVHLLHLAQGLKSGDEILVPSLTAFPSIEPMIHAGAKPVFCWLATATSYPQLYGCKTMSIWHNGPKSTG